MIALVVICALGAPAWAAEDDGQTPQARIGLAAWYGDFPTIERLYAAHARERDDQGYAMIGRLRSGLDKVFKHEAHSPLYHDQLVALTLRWTERHAQSPLAHALHIRALLDRAWWFRGTDFSNKVPREAMAEFERTIDRARDHAARHAGVALLDSSTHLSLINIGMAQSWSAEQLWAVASQGLDRNPEDDSLYLVLAAALTPKWGGAPRDLERIALRAVERTKATRGHELYARMYSRAASADYGQRLFEDSHARWPAMKQGYEDWLARYPANNGILNRFAFFACMARDQATALDLLGRIGTRIELDEWGRNGARTVETCRRWAGRQ